MLRIGPIRVTNTGSGPFPSAAPQVRQALPAAITRFPTGPNGTPDGAHSAEISWLRAGRPIPAIATSAFLAAASQHIGSVVSLPIDNVAVRMRIVASVSAFPTIPASGGGLILDQDPLQQALLAAGAEPLQATEWWLRAPSAPDFGGIASGLQITSRTAIAASFTGDPFGVDVRLALAAIAVAAVILAIAGFAVAAAAARERRPELALLDALGMPRRQLTRMLRTEQALLAVPSAVVGLALGALLAHLIVPALTLTPTGGAPAIPVRRAGAMADRRGAGRHHRGLPRHRGAADRRGQRHRYGAAPGSTGMRAVRRLLSGGAAPGPSRVLAAVLLVTSFLAVAAPRVLEIFQTRVLRETLAAAPAVDRSISVTSGYVTSGRARGTAPRPPPG